MSARISVRSKAIGQRGTASFREALRALLLLACGVLATACSSAPPPAPLAGPDPADAKARVPAIAYRSTTGPYASQRPVEPKPWLEQNQRVAPAEKP